jgi:outer membrane immunogenic protein
MPWFSTMRARVGYPVDSVMGGGIEGLVTKRWSTKLEYLYMGTPSTSLLPGSNETADNNLIRVGVNYHF